MGTQRPRRLVSLRLSLACLAIHLALTLALLLVVESRQRAAIVHQMAQRGETMAMHLAAVSTKSLLTYNFVTLEQDAEKIAQVRDVLYAIILDREGRVAASSGHDEHQGMVLPDTVSQQVAQVSTMHLQHVPPSTGTAEHYDIAVPVFVPGSPEKWGTVRVGLSLQEMQREIMQTRLQVLVLSVLGVASSFVVAAFLTSQAQRADHGR